MKDKCLLFALALLLFVFLYMTFNVNEDKKIVYDGGFFRIMQKDGESYIEIYDDGAPKIIEGDD